VVSGQWLVVSEHRRSSWQERVKLRRMSWGELLHEQLTLIAMKVKCYRELIAWQKAMDLVQFVYRATTPFPSTEIFGLTNQMRWSAVSVPSNIAEGQGRGTTRDFIHFLAVARGSLQELETQIQIAERLQYLDSGAASGLMASCEEVSRILHGLRSSLERR
jgi:four helix bundle protein